MAPTPITATHRLDIPIAVPDLRPHHLHLFVNASTSSDTDGYDFLCVGSGTVGMSTALTNLLPLIAAVYNGGVSLGSCVLEEHITGAWVPVATDSTIQAGGSSTVSALTTQCTISSRLPGGDLVRFQMMEQINIAPNRWTTVASNPTQLGLLIADLFLGLTTTAGGWIRSRDARFLSSGAYISTTIGLNKRLRRDRGKV